MRSSVAKYDENRDSQFDYELWLRLVSEGCNLAKIDLQLHFHRIHEGQSFEGKMGKIYRWRSFKLKLKYISIPKDFKELLYIVMKLGFDFLLPRNFRLKIKEHLS